MSISNPIRKVARSLLPLAERGLGSIKGARTNHPVVSLTFDDGPHPSHTPAILDVLEQFKVKATFFFVAQRAVEHADLARRVVDEGHEVGLHSIDHLPFPVLTSRAVADRVWNGKRMLEEVLARDVKLFRPPYGYQTLRTYLLARLAGLQVVGWTAVCQDWEPLEIDEIVARGVDRLEPGGILLLHDYVEPYVLQPTALPDFDRSEMVARLLAALREGGYDLQTVGELTSEWPARRTLWFWWRSEHRKMVRGRSVAG